MLVFSLNNKFFFKTQHPFKSLKPLLFTSCRTVTNILFCFQINQKVLTASGNLVKQTLASREQLSIKGCLGTLSISFKLTDGKQVERRLVGLSEFSEFLRFRFRRFSFGQKFWRIRSRSRRGSSSLFRWRDNSGLE